MFRVPLPIRNAQIPHSSDKEFLDSSNLKLTLATTPFLRMTDGLTYLLQYPYGCIEQTSSKVLPLAALRGLIQEGLIPEITLANTDKFLKAGISRLFKMQTESGGFGYWPGNKSPHKWGTLYAMTALSIAKVNGLDVPKEAMSQSIQYLKELLNKEEDLEENFIALASYVLSLNGASNSFSPHLFQSIKNKDFEARMFWILAGNNTGFLKNSKLRKITNNVLHFRNFKVNPPLNYGEFNALHRYKAVALLAANSIDPDSPLTHKMANALMQGMDSGGFWTSTSDTGWALFALGEYFKGKNYSRFPVRIKIALNDETEKEVFLDQSSHTMSLDMTSLWNNPKIGLESDTKEPIYYKATLKYPRLDYAQSGASNGFKVWKTIENLDGASDIKVGDIVKVTLNIDIENVSYRHPYNYVVIDDPLPAGMVAINSAIKTEEHIETKENEESYWNEDGAYNLIPSFVEMKDDRVLVFKDKMTWDGTYQYTYYARAIIEGDFILPSTKAQLMYSPQVAGFTPKGTIEILGR